MNRYWSADLLIAPATRRFRHPIIAEFREITLVRLNI
jgi:hypothetical protein